MIKSSLKRRSCNPVGMAQGCWDWIKGFHGLAAIQRPSVLFFFPHIFFCFSCHLLGFSVFPFFLQRDPNNRERALVYFCLMPKKQQQPLEMTNRLIRLVGPAAEPARLPWWLLDYLAVVRPSMTEQLRRKCLWCFHFKATFLKHN